MQLNATWNEIQSLNNVSVIKRFCVTRVLINKLSGNRADVIIFALRVFFDDSNDALSHHVEAFLNFWWEEKKKTHDISMVFKWHSRSVWNNKKKNHDA